ncbi:MAG TPA: nucleotide exchange factor GrpE [Acidobacteriota bacterium]|nr:nucleotide exchange factor GrpE [Acidobacteriota bacterium]
MSRKRHIKVEGPSDSGEADQRAAPGPAESPSSSDETVAKSPREGNGGEAEQAEAAVELSEEEKLRARVEELEDQLLRAMADLDNFRKRSARRIQDVAASANDRLIGELLEVVDNFERSFEHAEEAANAEAIRQGTRMVYAQMKDLLGKYEVRPIEALGRTFDPRYHEALMQVDSDEYDEGLVAMEVSRGYMIGDRVLRHAKVGVSRGAPTDRAGTRTEVEED